MSVAKTYVNFPIVDDPYEKNGRLYVHIKRPCCDKANCTKCGGTGSYLKEVRWYSNGETLATSSFDGRTAFGFGEAGYITLLKGPQKVLDDYFKNVAPGQARYNLLFFWYVPSSLPIPAELPENVELVRLNWTQVCDSNGRIQDYNIVRKLVSSLLGFNTGSCFVGTVGERITRNLTVIEVSQESGYYSTSKVYLLKDKDSNYFLWKTLTGRLELNKTYLLNGTIKDHQEINNVRHTILTRCKEAAN